MIEQPDALWFESILDLLGRVSEAIVALPGAKGSGTNMAIVCFALGHSLLLEKRWSAAESTELMDLSRRLAQRILGGKDPHAPSQTTTQSARAVPTQTWAQAARRLCSPN